MHRLDGVHHQVQDDLLQLDFVAFHGRKLIVEVRLNFYAVFLQIVPQDCQHRPDKAVDVDGTSLVRIFSEHRTNIGDDIRSAMTGFPDMGQRGLRSINIGRLSRKPAQRRTGARRNARERLVDLMSDGG